MSNSAEGILLWMSVQLIRVMLALLVVRVLERIQRGRGDGSPVPAPTQR
jgi:hypothetical protein